MLSILLTICCFAALPLYLWHVNRATSTLPAEVEELIQKPWTPEQIKEAYRQAQTTPTDVVPYLFQKKDRRYVVVGGSGKMILSKHSCIAHNFRPCGRLDSAAFAHER